LPEKAGTKYLRKPSLIERPPALTIAIAIAPLPAIKRGFYMIGI
jgi:hypothetical protein